jgi:hypothetical protein
MEAFEQLWLLASDVERKRIERALVDLINNWILELNLPGPRSAMAGFLVSLHRLAPAPSPALISAILSCPAREIAEMLTGMEVTAAAIPSSWLAFGYGKIAAPLGPKIASDVGVTLDLILSNNRVPTDSRFGLGSLLVFAAIEANRSDILNTCASTWLSLGEQLTPVQLEAALAQWDLDAPHITLIPCRASFSILLHMWFFHIIESELRNSESPQTARIAKSFDRLCLRDLMMDAAFTYLCDALREQHLPLKNARIQPATIVNYLRKSAGALEQPGPSDLLQWTAQAFEHCGVEDTAHLSDRYENAPRFCRTNTLS